VISSHAGETGRSYLALDRACHDVQVFAIISVALGVAILAAAVYFAASFGKILGSIAVLAYFPFASAFVLSQHWVSLRIKQAEYADASPVRRQKIAAEVRQYQEMMMACGLNAPVTGVIGALRAQRALTGRPAR
jgi:hypothetical protein